MTANRWQRVASVGNMLERLPEIVFPFVEKNDDDADGFAKFIVLCNASSSLDDALNKDGKADAQDEATKKSGAIISPSVHTAALSPISTLGGIAGSCAGGGGGDG